jgi:hypothetical protein
MRAAACLLLLAGCASAPRLPPPELVLAQRALARVEDGPFASFAGEEIVEAEALLTAAERAHERGSPSAGDDAYVAWRAAERAFIAGRYAAAREALFKARRAARHLADDVDRRASFFASLARRRAAKAALVAERRRAMLDALRRVEPAGAFVAPGPDAIVVRFSTEGLFLRGTSLFRDGGEDRLGALCEALAGAPPFELRLAIVDDVEGFHTAPLTLASRRYARVLAALRARKATAHAQIARLLPSPGAQVDVIVVLPDPPLPPDG